METENREIRIIPIEESEVRAVGNSRKIEGYGIVFNSESRDLGGFREVILPEAINGVLESSDVLALLNHDIRKGVLARSENGKGTLKLQPDQRGVKYSFDAPNYDLGDELLEGVRRGDIKGSSFSFTLPKDGEKWNKERTVRIITKFDRIYDMSPVYHEAYPDTTVALRSLEKLKDEAAEPETKVEEIEVKPITDEPVIEPVTERTEPEVKAEEPIIEQRNINLKNNKMTLIELRDKKAKALDENDKIFEAKAAENRTMTEDEKAKTACNNQLVEELELQIETEQRKTGKGIYQGPRMAVKEEEPFSLMAAIRAKAEQRELPPAARVMNIRGREMFQKAGISAGGDIILPYEMRSDELYVTGGAGLGVELVPEDKKPILPPLMNQLVFSQAGATYLTGLTGDVSVPSFSNATIAWKGEITAAVTAAITSAEVLFSPKKLTAFIEVSKLFLIQTGPAAERLLMDILSAATARKLESTILGVAAGSSTQPQGMGYKITTGTDTKANCVVPTYASLVALESAVDANNALVDNLAYITNPGGRGILKSIDKGVNNDTGDMLCSETGIVNGYKLLVTNGASAIAGDDDVGDLLVFGNWKDLCICQWGGYDITVNPYTLDKEGMIRITINAFFDIKGLRGSVATDVHSDGTDADDYGISFASTAIKIS